MPAQPPFLTPTRTAAIGFSARAEISLMRAAAASLRRMTCNFGLGFVVDGAAIVFLVELNHLICGPRGPERMWPREGRNATFLTTCSRRRAPRPTCGSDPRADPTLR